MGSGNWFGNVISSIIVQIIFGIIMAIGSFLNIFAAWDVTNTMAVDILEQWALPAMSTRFKGNMAIGS